MRKTVLVVGMPFGLAVFGATQTTNPHFWPVRLGGIMNFLNNMMGVVAPIVTGFIVSATDNFETAFLIAGIVLGLIEPIPAPE